MNKPCFIAVTNRNLCKRPFFDVIEDLSKKDVKTIVLREKDLSEEEYYEIAEKCKEICDRNGASLTIHNFIDVARRLGIKKIHLPYPVFLKEAGNLSDFESVSTSIHKPEEAIKAQKLGADFVFAGHVFVTDPFLLIRSFSHLSLTDPRSHQKMVVYIDFYLSLR
jgi:thiamine-phosphate pyrophosphorylase